MSESPVRTPAERAPAVSVIVPTFDRLPLLRETIASGLDQTCGSWRCHTGVACRVR